MNCKAYGFLVASTFAVVLSHQAIAADLPAARPDYRAPAVVPAPVFSWTGCYLGANVGGASDRHKYTTNAFAGVAGQDAGSHTATAFIAGGQVGCNYQTGPLVVGVEGMFDWADLNRSHFVPAAGVTLGTDTQWLATATGRVGYAFDRVLVYAKGGGAWIQETQSVTVGALNTNDGGRTRAGWTAGGGWEYAFADNWSVKIEYNYMDFGTKGTTTCTLGVCAATGVNDKETLHAVFLGLNFRF